MKKRSSAQTAHVMSVPRIRPAGTAVLHQFSASSLTKRRICRRLAPTQRSMPKNFVRWATLLFMPPEIISTPASSTRKKRTKAIP